MLFLCRHFVLGFPGNGLVGTSKFLAVIPAHPDPVPTSCPAFPVAGRLLGHIAATADALFLRCKWLFLGAVPTNHTCGKLHLVSTLAFVVALVAWVGLPATGEPET